MTQPVLGNFGQLLYDALEPLAWQDEQSDWALANFAGAIGEMFQEVDTLARDTPAGKPGWSVVIDLERAPTGWLPWLAQFVGVTIPKTITDDETQRAWVAGTDGFNRGTPAAINTAAQVYLTGDKTVYLVERYGSAYSLLVTTYADETPLSNYDDFLAAYATFNALDAAYATYGGLLTYATRVATHIAQQVPAGITFEHRSINRGTYDEVTDSHASYTVVQATYVTLAEILADPTKQ